MDRDEFAKRLIGRPGRVRLARWILKSVEEDEYFYQDQARKGTGDVISEVRMNLDHLEELGMIRHVPRDPGLGRRQYYRRNASSAWRVFVVVIDVIDNLELEPRELGLDG